jgi:5-methyltetrahydrofolate--homocysteine methyltransferase
MKQIVQAVQDVTDVPLCIDSHHPRVLEAGLCQCMGKAMVNSVNGKERSLAEILPLVRDYGAALIGLTIDQDGLPQTSGQRLRIATKIVERAERAGISRNDVIVDPVVLAARSDARAARQALEGIRLIVRELGVNITVGSSNLSFGLSNRPAINATFLTMAIASGATCPIANPLDARVRQAIRACDLILGHGDWMTEWAE